MVASVRNLISAIGDGSLYGRGWRISILLAIPMAVAAYVVALLLEHPSGQQSPYDLSTYTGLAIVFILLEVLLLLNRITLNETIYTILTVVSLQFTGKLIYLLFFNPNPVNIHEEMTETFFWIPTIYVLASFIPGLKKGRILTLVFFTATTLISVGYIAPNLFRGTNFGVIYALYELNLANLTLLALTQTFVGFKDNLVRANTRAETMERLAYRDILTGLPNRLFLETKLDELLRQTDRRQEKVAIFFLDVDGFKAVNDTLGHTVGDNLLKGIATRLNEETHPGWLISRISGDEFVVAAPSLLRETDTLQLGRRIKASLDRPFTLDGEILSITASVGISVYPDDGATSRELLKHADTAMYHVKSNGKNGARMFQKDEGNAIEERTALVHDLRQAINQNDLTLHYQPMFNLSSGEMVKAEALMRWQHRDKGWISPAAFIPAAEQSGLITEIGRWAMYQACYQLKRWHQLGADDLKISVNVSAYQFAQPDFVHTVSSALDAAGIAPGNLELELTESVIINGIDHVKRYIGQLRDMGVSVAIDDFGSGFSSLSYFEHLPVNTVKIDRTFIKKLGQTRVEPHFSLALVQAVMDIAQALDLEVVAEGIENEDQSRLLKGLGIDVGQGYFFAKPMDPADFNEMLRVRRGLTTEHGAQAYPSGTHAILKN